MLNIDTFNTMFIFHQMHNQKYIIFALIVLIINNPIYLIISLDQAELQLFYLIFLLTCIFKYLFIF